MYSYGGSPYYNPYYYPCCYPGYYRAFHQWQQTFQRQQTFSYVRLLHASPNTESVDIYAKNSLIARGLAYKGFTEYMPMLPGIYDITIFKTGTTAPALLNTGIEVPGRSINTAVLIGLSPDIVLKAFFETVVRIPSGQLYLRFANLAPGSPDMDLLLSDGTGLFTEVSYGMATNYTALPAGTYVFQLRQSNTSRRLLYVPNIYLSAGRFYTVYAVGQIGGDIPLQVLIPLDGNSYIRPG